MELVFSIHRGRKPREQPQESTWLDACGEPGYRRIACRHYRYCLALPRRPSPDAPGTCRHVRARYAFGNCQIQVNFTRKSCSDVPELHSQHLHNWPRLDRRLGDLLGPRRKSNTRHKRGRYRISGARQHRRAKRPDYRWPHPGPLRAPGQFSWNQRDVQHLPRRPTRRSSNHQHGWQSAFAKTSNSPAMSAVRKIAARACACNQPSL